MARREQREELNLLVLDSARGATIKGLLGALIDLGFAPVEEILSLSERLDFAAPEIGLETYAGCSGFRITIPEGAILDDSERSEKAKRMSENDPVAARLLGEIYEAIRIACGEDQGYEDADIGRFARADVFQELALTAYALSRAKEELGHGLIVTPIELGGGIVLDHGAEVDAPSTLVTRLLSDLTVAAHPDARGVDVPTAAVVAAAAEGETAEIFGALRSCGCGVDEERVTRVYVLGAEYED